MKPAWDLPIEQRRAMVPKPFAARAVADPQRRALLADLAKAELEQDHAVSDVWDARSRLDNAEESLREIERRVAKLREALDL